MSTQTMSHLERTAQEEIASHLAEWAYWYTRATAILRGTIPFPDEQSADEAGEFASDQWEEACIWLEEHDVTDDDIVYDETTQTASLSATWVAPESSEEV